MGFFLTPRLLKESNNQEIELVRQASSMAGPGRIFLWAQARMFLPTMLGSGPTDTDLLCLPAVLISWVLGPMATIGR